MIHYFCLFSVPNTPRQDSKVWKQIKQFSPNLNFFPSTPPSTDKHELRIQRMSTTLFIFLLIGSLVILLRTWPVSTTKVVNVQTPSLTQYEQFYSTDSQTLTCTCTKASIEYKKFLHIEYTLHQVCSSIFVDQSWINYLTTAATADMQHADFRRTGPSVFQALRIFCQLSDATIANSLIRFYSSQYVSVSVTPLHLFESETKSLIDQFRLSMTNAFLLSLAMIRDTTQANALLSGLQTNYVLKIDNNNSYLNVNAVSYVHCNCASSSSCIYPSLIVPSWSTEVLFLVKGFYTGCYVIESLLQSTLECFYDQQCIDGLKVYLSSSWSMNVAALNSSLPSHYFVNSTIQDLVNNLMIEQWNCSSMYKRYYNACQPTQCTYIKETNNRIYSVYTVIGTVGGLIVILQFFIPRLVKCIVYCVRKREMNVVPQVSNIPT